MWLEGDGTQTFEGQILSCTFPTGVTVTTNIDANAASLADYTWAGWASNGYEDFNCYKDNGRQLYTFENSDGQKSCNSIYWCNPVSW